VIFEVMLLALASTIRPTSLAAVSALLGRESRRRLMFAYVTCGLIFTVGFGILVIGVFHGIHVNAGSSRTKGIADILGGVAALLFWYAMLRGKVERRSRPPADERENWLSRLDRQVTVRVAAVAGPLTHIPGIFYLIALNLIVAHNARLAGGLLAVGIYNAIWFALPLGALVLCIVKPDAARKLVADVALWAKRHSRTIILAASFTVGCLLIVRGILML
jgi:hypothetical protein